MNGLWIGDTLSSLELLTLHSFVEKGHVFQLWVYDDIENDLPKGVVLRDANTIIPEDEIFVKKMDDPHYGIGKGSLGTFSDLFRYKLLYIHGGWWVDMDIVCLQPFDFKDDYFFRSHPLLPMIGNIIKCPPNSNLMKMVYEEAKAECGENTQSWLQTNQILNSHIRSLNLQDFIFDNYSNADDWLQVERYIYTNRMPDERWVSIHWMNEEWRRRKLNKDVVFRNTCIHNLYDKYNISIQIEDDNLRRNIYWCKQYFRNFKNFIKSILHYRRLNAPS